MIARVVLALVLLLGSTAALSADDRYSVTGIVLDVRPATGTFVASIDAIPR